MEVIVSGGSHLFLALSSCKDLLRITQQKQGKINRDVLHMKEKAWEIYIRMCKRTISAEVAS